MAPTADASSTTVDEPVDGRAARWQGQRERRRAEIVDHAVEVIERLGPAASVADIAAACGVTRQVLYRHFEGRDDLDRAIADRGAALLLAHLDGKLSAEGGIEAGLRRALDAFLDFVEAHRHLYDFIRSADRGRHGVEVVDRMFAVITTIVADIAAGLDLDECSPVPLTEVFAVGVVGLADAVVSRWLSDPQRLDRAAMSDGLVTLLLASIGAVLDE